MRLQFSVSSRGCRASAEVAPGRSPDCQRTQSVWFAFCAQITVVCRDRKGLVYDMMRTMKDIEVRSAIRNHASDSGLGKWLGFRVRPGLRLEAFCSSSSVVGLDKHRPVANCDCTPSEPYAPNYTDALHVQVVNQAGANVGCQYPQQLTDLITSNHTHDLTNTEAGVGSHARS